MELPTLRRYGWENKMNNSSIIDHALSVIADPAASTASLTELTEALLLLEACDPLRLHSILRSLSRKDRLRWITSLESMARTNPASAVEILYVVFLLVHPDPEGARHYTTLLQSERITVRDMAHLLSVRRLHSILLYAPSAFLFHLFGYLQVKIRRGSLRTTTENTGRISPAEPCSTASEDQHGEAEHDLPSIAIVIHRAGTGFSGGAERNALDYARYLSEIARVEIITTQARDYLTWKNEYPGGLQIENGIRLRRFPVKHERHRLFHKLSAVLFRLLSLTLDRNASPSSLRRASPRFILWKMLTPLASLWMRFQGPHSPALVEYVRHRSYDLYVFFTYLYETTYTALPHVADRAVVVPTAHPERPLQMPIWQKIFQDGRPGWIFLTEEERRFLRQWFPGMNDGPVIGCGIASRAQLERMQKMRKSGSSVFKDRFSINGPFVLYTGRVDSEKGCRTLIACFLAFLRQSKRRVTLVLVGSKAMTVPEHPSIIATGFIENDLMLAALSECSVYIHPSPYESFSFSLLEAMAAGAPVLVTAECDVLRGHVIRSRAGLYYRDMKDFVEKLTVLLDEPERFQTGPQYVQKRYSHEAIRGPLQRYLLERIGDQ